MANYCGSARTNYFRIRPELREEFNKCIAAYEVELHEARQDHGELDGRVPGMVALISTSDDGGWDNPMLDEDMESEDDTVHADLPATLGALVTEEDDELPPIWHWIAPFLVEDEVAIFQEIGSERLRYLVGFAIAIHSSGEQIDVSLDQIYAEAQEAFGSKASITQAQY